MDDYGNGGNLYQTLGVFTSFLNQNSMKAWRFGWNYSLNNTFVIPFSE